MRGSKNSAKLFWSCSSTLKVTGLFVLCSMVYVYLYLAVSIHPVTVKDLVQDTTTDLQKCRNKIESQHLFPHLNISTNILYIEQHVKPTNPTTELYEAEKAAVLKNESIPLLTLFTTWTTNKEKYICHNNTVTNWSSFRPFVEPVLFTNETDLKNRIMNSGWSSLPVSKARNGVPILKYMYLDVMNKFKTKFYAYCNGDILFTDSLILTLLTILNSTVIPHNKPVMAIGRRTNVKDVTRKDASTWANIKKAGKCRGKIFTTFAEDYFITIPIYPWKDIPEVVVGRRAYDNWLVLNARKQGHTTIDASNTVVAVHQTTKSGNYEGRSHKNGEYNHKLLRKMYKRLHYGGGLTSCAEFYTSYNSTGEPVILKRKVHQSCFPL